VLEEVVRHWHNPGANFTLCQFGTDWLVFGRAYEPTKDSNFAGPAKVKDSAFHLRNRTLNGAAVACRATRNTDNRANWIAWRLESALFC
jgi:uncharacterized cupin superfamily protein